MAKDGFSFEDGDFGMPSFDEFDMGNSSGGGKKKSFFKDLAKGVVIGSYGKMEKYIPALQGTRESASDMADQIRDQAYAVRQQATKAGTYFKGVTEDISKITDSIRNTKGLGAKIRAAEQGFDQAKKNLAYAIDPEAAASFDMDAMFGDDDYGSSSSSGTTVTAGKSTSHTNDPTTTETKLRNEKLGIDMDFGIEPPNQTSQRTSGKGGKIFNQNVISGDSSEKIQADRLANQALRETIMASSAAIISSQSKIFKQTNIINTKLHLEKMNALNRIAEATNLSAKMYAEQIAPTQKVMNDRMAKSEAQLNDVIALLRDGSSSDSPIRSAMTKGNRRGGKRNIMDFITASGGVDLGGLYKHAVTQAKDQADGMGLGMISGLKDMIPMTLMGGDKTSAGMALGKLLGGALMMPFKGKITAMSDKVSQIIPNMMMTGLDKMKHSDNGFLNSIAELLNIDTGTKGTVDLDTRNRRVSFDMVTRRSIVEVIPGYLSKILSSLNGKEEMAFDHKTGQFTTKGIMQNKLQKQIDNAGMGSFDSVKSNLSRKDSTLKDSDVNKILKNIMMSGRPFDVAELGDSRYYNTMSEGVSKEAFTQFLDAYDKLDPMQKASINISANRARKSRTDTLNDLSINLSEYGEGSFLGASQINAKIKDLERQKTNIDKLKGDNSAVDLRGQKIMMDKIRKNANIDMEIADLKTIQAASGEVSGSDKVSTAVNESPINKIYNLLLDGIIVYPKQMDKVPDHIRSARKTRTAELKSKNSAKETLDKANAEYDRIIKELSSQQAEEVENALENRRLNGIQKMKKIFGNSPIFQRFAGSDTMFGKILDTVEKNPIYQGYQKFNNGVINTLDKVESGIDKYTTATGFDVSGAASNIMTGMEPAEQKKFVSNAMKGIRGDVNTPEGQQKIIESVSKMSNDKLIKLSENAIELSKTVKGKFVLREVAKRLAGSVKNSVVNGVTDTVDNIKTSDGRKELGNKIKSEATNLANAGKAKVEELAETESGKKVKDAINATRDTLTDTVDNIKTSDGRKELGNKIKSEATNLANAGKAKVEELAETISDKIPKNEQIDVPEGLKTPLAKESMDPSTKAKLGDVKNLGVMGALNVFTTATMSKFNRALFGKDETKIPHKTGFLGTMFDKVRSLPKMVMSFLVGNKETGKVGLLQTMGAPFLKMMENARHNLMSKFIIPFKSIGEQMKESIKWKARDRAIWLKNLGVKLKGSKEEQRAKKEAKRQKKLEKLAKKNEKRIAKGKDPKYGRSVWNKVFGMGEGLSNVAISPFALATNLSLKRSNKKMRDMLANGKISQEDYDKWVNDQAEAQDAELARHNRNQEEIKALQNRVDMSRIKDEKLRAEVAGMNSATSEQQAKIDKMSYKDIKADQKRAKEQMKLNKEKLARGEKLTKEEEYGALTQQQLLYRMQDDNKKKLEAEVKRQEETAEKEKLEMQRNQTNATLDIKDLVSGLLWTATKGKAGKKPAGASEQAKKDEARAKELSGSTTDPNIDKVTGHKEGSYLDQLGDKEKTTDEQILGVLTDTKELLSEKTASSKIEAEKADKEKSGISKMLGSIGGLIGGIATLGFGMAGVAGIKNSAKNVFNRFKKEGAVNGFGELFGIDRTGDSNFDMDGNRKSGLTAAMDRFHGGRYLLRGGLKKSVGRIAKGSKNIIKHGGNLIGGAATTPLAALSKTVKGSGKLISKLGGTKAAKAVTSFGNKLGGVAKAGSKAGSKITEMLTKFFNIPAIAKKIPKGKVGGLIAKISTKIAGSAAGKAAAGALKFISGPIGIAAMAAADFATGAAQAKRYFKIGPGDKATVGMRTAAGLANALNNALLLGLLPMDWLVETIYRLVANKEQEAELDAKQQAFRERAEALGVDPERLNELENKTLGKKFMGLFKSEDKKLAEEAKLMGMDIEEYKQWKEEYDKLNSDSKELENKKKSDKAKETAAAKMEAENTVAKNGGVLLPSKTYSTTPKKTSNDTPKEVAEKVEAKPKKTFMEKLKGAFISSGFKKAGNIGLQVLKTTFPLMFAAAGGAKKAIEKFKNNRKATQAELEKSFTQNPAAAIEFGKSIADPSAKGQQKNVNTLSPEMKKRVNAMLKDNRVAGKGVSIREGYRAPLTQLAYYSKGRAPKEVTDSLMKEAGFPAGINFWGKGFQGPGQNITWTLASNHFDGNAVDLEPGKVGYDALGKIAGEYGIEWGGNWSTPDKPHFELDKSWKGKLPDKIEAETIPPESVVARESSSDQSKTSSGTPTPESTIRQEHGNDSIAVKLENSVPNTSTNTSSGNMDVAGAKLEPGNLGSANTGTTNNKSDIVNATKPVEDVASTNDVLINKYEELATKAQDAQDNAAKQSHNDMAEQTGTISKQLSESEKQTQLLSKLIELMTAQYGGTPAFYKGHYVGQSVDYDKNGTMDLATPNGGVYWDPTGKNYNAERLLRSRAMDKKFHPETKIVHTPEEMMNQFSAAHNYSDVGT